MYTQQKLKLLLRLDSIYINFSKNAETRYGWERATSFEYLSAQAKLEETRLEMEQAKSDVLIQQTVLQGGTGATTIFDTPDKVVVSESHLRFSTRHDWVRTPTCRCNSSKLPLPLPLPNWKKINTHLHYNSELSHKASIRSLLSMAIVLD
jgi:hypothetical protein